MWSETLASLPMTTLAVLWGGAFLGGVASGAAGFAFGIASAAIWLHALTPVHTTFLVVAGGLTHPGRDDLAAAQRARSAAHLAIPAGGRHRRSDRRLAPGPHRGGVLKAAIGVFLGVYGLYALLAPRLPHVEAGRWADTLVGFIGGVLGGIGGYSGVGPAIWAQLRGWPKDMARAFYQPFIVVAHVTTLVVLGTVALDRTGLVLFVLALPALALGAWADGASTAASTKNASARCLRCC